MFVLTMDQRRSRSLPDAVPSLLDALAEVAVLRPFERTVGDEVQAVVDDPDVVVGVVLAVARRGGWSVGVGAGPVRTPLPPSTRAGAGPAFELARAAEERAKTAPHHLAVRGADAGAAEEAEAVLALLADLLARRSALGWEVSDLLATGFSQAEVAIRLGVSRQAVSQRARAAGVEHERRVRPVTARMLARAQGER